MNISATKSKKELKDVFGKAGTLLYDSNVLDLAAAKTGAAAVDLVPELDVPVLVDSISITQDDPELTHVKIIGLSGDWYMDGEPGDSNIEFTVPTKNSDILKLAYGEDAVGEYFVHIGKNTTSTGEKYTAYKGTGLVPKFKKVTGTFAILNKEKDQLLLISGAELFASALYGDDNTVYAVKFTGAIVSDDASPNFLWLKDADTEEVTVAS